MDINPGAAQSGPTEFVELGKKVYFVSSFNDYLDALWQTDGTTAGTKLVKSLGIDPGGFLISQLVSANNLLFFTFLSYTTNSYELWRSDGTDAGRGGLVERHQQRELPTREAERPQRVIKMPREHTRGALQMKAQARVTDKESCFEWNLGCL